MIREDEFRRHVHTAFARLDDRPGLATHPLASLLGAPGRSASPEALRRLLLEAVDQLRPPEGSPASSVSWRRWRCLVLRYAEGATTQRIAQQLRVSPRQALRDCLAGTEAVATLLWDRYRQQVEKAGREPVRGRGSAPTELALANPGVVQEDLESELARVSVPAAGEPTNVTEILEGVLSTVQILADARQVHLSVAIPDDLRPVACNSVVLRQILLCLVSAIISAHPSASVGISGAHGLSTAVLRMDVGRKAARSPKRFASAGDADELISTARRLTDAVGGTLQLDTRSDGSWLITLTLPAAPLITVLVVDDNPDVVHLFRWYLTGANYHLIQARTPPAALELARALHPDVITLDVMMPSKDGWQILQELRSSASTRDIPVIVCTVLAEQPLARSLGVTEFLAKPITSQALSAALERCLKARSAGGRPGSGAGTS